MNCNQKELGCDRLGWMDRYFLRRFALARRAPKSHLATPYSEALFEVTVVAVLAPCMAVFSCVLMTSLKWAPTFAHTHPNFSPRIASLVFASLAIGAGNAWLRWRFRRFPSDAWADFDTESDRRMIFWQKRIILLVCGAVIPVLAVIVTVWIL